MVKQRSRSVNLDWAVLINTSRPSSCVAAQRYWRGGLYERPTTTCGYLGSMAGDWRRLRVPGAHVLHATDEPRYRSAVASPRSVPSDSDDRTPSVAAGRAEPCVGGRRSVWGTRNLVRAPPTLLVSPVWSGRALGRINRVSLDCWLRWWQ